MTGLFGDSDVTHRESGQLLQVMQLWSVIQITTTETHGLRLVDRPGPTRYHQALVTMYRANNATIAFAAVLADAEISFLFIMSLARTGRT